jgi:Tfp pilus assembly protein PilW
LVLVGGMSLLVGLAIGVLRVMALLVIYISKRDAR